MKLIGPQRTTAESLGRHNSSINVAAGEAEANKVETKAKTGLFATLAKEAEKAKLVRIRRQNQQTGLQVQEGSQRFWEQWGGRARLPINEVPDEFITDSMLQSNRTHIPAAELVPKMYNDHMDRIIRQSSTIIESEKYRKEWLTSAYSNLAKENTKNAIDANQQIEHQIFVEMVLDYEFQMEQGNAESALQITEDMVGNEELVFKYAQRANEATEINPYISYMTSGDLVNIQKSIDLLGQKIENYKGDGGKLEPKTQKLWFDKLTQYMNAVNSSSTSLANAEIRYDKFRAKEEVKNGVGGVAVDPADLQESLSKLQAHEKRKKGSAKVEIDQLRTGVEFIKRNNNQLLLPKEERESHIKDFKKYSSMKPHQKGSIIRSLQASNDAQTSLEYTDFMQSVENAKFIPNGLAPIDFSAPVGELVQQLDVRYDEFKAARENYGQGYGEGIFKNEEAKIFAAYLNGQTTNGKRNAIAAISKQFGTDAGDIYNQVLIDGKVGSLVIAGHLSAQGVNSVADSILMGDDFRKSYPSPSILSQAKKDMFAFLSGHIGDAYASNPQYNKAIYEATASHYFNTYGNEGVEKVDEDNIEKMVKDVTGGLIEHNGEMTAPPVYGMGQDRFHEWLNTMDHLELLEYGRVEGVSEADFLQEIRDVATLSYLGDNRYLVKRPNGVPYLRNLRDEKGKRRSYILEYRPDYRKSKHHRVR